MHRIVAGALGGAMAQVGVSFIGTGVWPHPTALAWAGVSVLAWLIGPALGRIAFAA